MSTGDDSGAAVERLKSVWNEYALHCYNWYPSSHNPRALVYISHGVTEHTGRYEELAKFLTESGMTVFGHDHVGHGRSEGERVHVESVDTYIQDVIRHVEQMKNKYPPHLPCFLVGHSMGGLIAAHTTIQRQELFTGLILSAPAVKPIPLSPITAAIARYGVKGLAVLMPKAPLFPWKTSNITSIPEEVRCYEEDNLTHCGNMRPSWTSAMMESMTQVARSLEVITLPVLLTHGADDPIVDYSSSEFVHNHLSSTDKTFMRFEGYHDMLHDVEREKVKTAIRDWISDHLKPHPLQTSS